MSLALQAQPLDAAALAPYATVLSAADGVARMVPEVMQNDGVSGAHAFTILCPQPLAGAVSITALERHPHSTQSFLPITSGRWLILIAPKTAAGEPDLSGALAFIAGPEDAICIHQDVWHAGLTVFDRPAQFAMIMWKAQAGDDGVQSHLSDAIAISL